MEDLTFDKFSINFDVLESEYIASICNKLE